MRFATVQEFARQRPALPSGVIGIVLCESERHAAATIERLARQGAAAILCIGPAGAVGDIGCPVIAIDQAPARDAQHVLNIIFPMLEGRWVTWLWNGEFLVFPYCETRTLADLTAFLADERRRSLFCYALDLYAQPMPDGATDPQQATLCFDRMGYHAFPKEDGQLRLFGGLGWRFEELAPPSLQQIGRPALVRVDRKSQLDASLLFDEPDLNTVACPWHNSPTGAVMTVRRSYKIMAHPQFPDCADKLIWPGTTPFEWSSRQLLSLGLIEPGQWF